MKFRESWGRSALLICMIVFHAKAYYSTLTGIFLLFAPSLMMARMGALDSLVNGLLFYLLYFLLSCAAYRSMPPGATLPRRNTIWMATCVLPNTCMLCLFHTNGAVTHLDISPSCEQRRTPPLSPQIIAGVGSFRNLLDDPCARWPAGHKVRDSCKWSDTFPLCARLSRRSSARKRVMHILRSTGLDLLVAKISTYSGSPMSSQPHAEMWFKEVMQLSPASPSWDHDSRLFALALLFSPFNCLSLSVFCPAKRKILLFLDFLKATKLFLTLASREFPVRLTFVTCREDFTEEPLRKFFSFLTFGEKLEILSAEINELYTRLKLFSLCCFH